MPSVRARFQAVMLRGDVSQGLPILKWAPWWKLTREHWMEQGVTAETDLTQFFGLDRHHQIWIRPRGKDLPSPTFHGGPIIANEADYNRYLPYLYQVPKFNTARMKQWHAEQEQGTSLLWFTLDGAFQHPRKLLGIQEHLFAFYDSPRLMKRMNEDLADFSIKVIDALCEHYVPDFMTFMEDMSYNHGPMISPDLMEEFMGPFYQRVIPELKRRGIIPIIDSDGGIESLIPWFEKAGLQGILPLERMAGVDVNRIRCQHPSWRMIGGFDKTVMHKGEAAMRAEFSRIRPAVLKGYFVPSCDHQTPPAVSVDDYRLYVRLLREFSAEVAASTKQAAKL